MVDTTYNWQDVAWQTYAAPTLKEFADTFNSHQINIRKAKQQHAAADNMANMENLYDSQTSSKNSNISSQSGRAIRMTQAAYWIRSFYNDNYADELNSAWINLNNMTEPDVIDWYTELNPNSYDILKDYVVTDKDINNPTDLYYTLWFMPSNGSMALSDRIKTAVNQIANDDWGKTFWEDSKANAIQYWKDFAKSELSWPTEMYYWLRNFVNWVQWLWNNDSNWFWAMQNYGYEVFWKDISALSDIEFYSAAEALKNPEVYADYAPTPAKWWIEALAWFTDTMFSIAAWPVKLIFSAAEAEPLTRPFMNILWWTQEKLMWEWIWWILTFPLQWYVNDLPEQDRKKFYAWLGSVLTLWLAFKSKNSWPWANDLFKWVMNDLWIDKLIRWFNDKILSDKSLIPVSPLELESWLENIPDSMLKQDIQNSNYYEWLPPETRKAIDVQSEKIINAKTVTENQDISRALAQLDQKVLKNAKTYEDLYKLNRTELENWIKMEDTIAWTIEKTFWPEEDIWAGDDVLVAWKYKWNTEPNHPIMEFFDTMKLLTKNARPNIRKALDWYEQKFLAWEITVQDLLNFKRALSQEYIRYKYKKTEWQELVSDTDIARVYDWLNYLIRDSVETIPEFRDMWLGNIMSTLDNRVSPHLTLRAELLNMINALNRDLWKIPENITTRRVKNAATWLARLSLRWILQWILDWAAKSKEKMTSPSDFAENLPNSISQIVKTLKKFPDEQRKLIMDSLAEYLDRKLRWPTESYWWKVEWEVIEDPWITDDFIDWTSEFERNPYLEDIVEVVPKESNMLWNDPMYNWNPVDYTNATRVTPEWYAWRKWATSESYQWKPAWDFWTPAEFENRQWSPYERTWEAYSQAMEQAGFSVKQIEKVKETLEKNDYKIKQQPSLFDEFPTQEETQAIIKNNKWQPKETMDLKSIMDELQELEDKANAAAEKTPLKKAKKSWKNSKKKDK